MAGVYFCAARIITLPSTKLGELFVSINDNCLFRALRPAKPYENAFESSRIGKAGSGKIDSTIEKSRPCNCLIRSVRR
jgi:hypothetical protein